MLLLTKFGCFRRHHPKNPASNSPSTHNCRQPNHYHQTTATMHVTSLAIRGAQFFLTILTLALSGALVAQQVIGGSPSQVNFALFASIWSFLAGFYTLYAAFSESGHSMILLAIDATNTLFTFAAGTALAAGLGVHSCGNMVYVRSNSITNGSHDPTARCHQAQALTAFLWFLFGTYLASLVLSVIAWRRGSIAPASTSRV